MNIGGPANGTSCAPGVMVRGTNEASLSFYQWAALRPKKEASHGSARTSGRH